MQRTFASLALATLSLFVSYAIVAAWPDRVATTNPGITKAATAVVVLPQPVAFVPAH